MHNLDFLQSGKIFPPLEEAKRIGACAEYDLMFDGNTYAVEQRVFKETLRNLNKLALLLGWTNSYISVEYNYFKLCSKKTADFICGEYPDIRATNGDENIRKREQAVLDLIRKETLFDKKHYDAWLDVSKYGEEFLRVYRKNSKGTFTLQSPAMLLRVTSEEDDYETLYYVVAWIANDGRELHTQIHSRGQYTVRNFLIEPALVSDLTGQIRYESANVNNGKSDMFSLLRDRYTDEIFRCNAFRIGEQIGKDRIVETGLNDFAIVELSGIKNADRSHGVSDYDDFSSIVNQMQRTMTQVQLIFDKYTTPTAYGATEILTQCDDTGENVMEIGKFWGIPENGVVPGFLEPDLSKLQYYFEQLQFNIDRIKELSEMGAAFTADTSVANVAVETMKATYSSALKKAERLTTKNTGEIKKLFYLVSQLGYDTVVPVEDISITWYDGLPNDEQKDIDAARSKVENGLSCRKHEYVNRFDHTEDEFDSMWTQYLSEESDLNTVRAAEMFNPFTPKNSGTGSEEKFFEREGEDNDDNDDKGETE